MSKSIPAEPGPDIRLLREHETSAVNGGFYRRPHRRRTVHARGFGRICHRGPNAPQPVSGVLELCVKLGDDGMR